MCTYGYRAPVAEPITPRANAAPAPDRALLVAGFADLDWLREAFVPTAIEDLETPEERDA